MTSTTAASGKIPEDGAPGIEITPAMMAAGYAAMRAWYNSDADLPAGARLVYEAMTATKHGRCSDAIV